MMTPDLHSHARKLTLSRIVLLTLLSLQYNKIKQTAAVIRETGPSSVMKVEKDYPTPKLNPGSVLIKNKFSGINFIDTYHRSGCIRETCHLLAVKKAAVSLRRRRRRKRKA